MPLLGFPRGAAPDSDVYPIISPAALTNRGTEAATQSINLPADLRYGDIVVGVVNCDGAPTAIAYPDASWVQMNSYSAQLAVFFYRICDGSPLDRLTTLDLTLTVPRRVCGATWRVRGAERQAPIFSGLSNNTSTPMNPPNVNLVTTTGIAQTARAALVLVLARLSGNPPGLIAGYTEYDCAKLSADDLSSGIVAIGCWRCLTDVSEDPPGNSGGNASTFGVMTAAFLAARSKAAGIL